MARGFRMPGIKNQVEIRIFSRRTVRLCSRHKKRRHKDAFFIKYGRGRGIRTPDILLPKQARYLTALYPGLRIAKPKNSDSMTNRNYCSPQTAACLRRYLSAVTLSKTVKPPLSELEPLILRFDSSVNWSQKWWVVWDSNLRPIG